MNKQILFQLSFALMFALVFDVYGQACPKSLCPTNCQFGHSQVKVANGTNCLKCLCNPNPCDNVTCPLGSVCEVQKEFGKNKKHNKPYHCIAKVKNGECPVQSNTTSCVVKKIKNCESDSVCPGVEKCCSDGCNSICTKPCITTKCSCTGNNKLVLHMNSKGCSACTCTKEITVKSNLCDLPKQPGNCKASMKRFYYDTAKKECKEFVYSGCGGNDNKFMSKLSCERECSNNTESVKDSRIVDENTCSLAKEVGPCKKLETKFYFDANSKRCKEFDYGGCMGNENRFDSKIDCEASCLKLNNTMPLTKDVSRNEADKVCTLPKETGPCKAFVDMFHYDSISKTCVEFKYGGCQGNENRFESKSACEKRCAETKHNKHMEKDAENNTTILCSLPKDSGPCKAAFPRFFFDSTTKKCDNFTYGGCQGNENRFETKEKCEAKCISSSPMSKTIETKEMKKDVCLLPKDAGMCFAYLPNFYFNSAAGSCEEFIYGGCQGNENRFETLEACENRCKKSNSSQIKDIKKDAKIDSCLLPKESGLCLALFERFFFNSTSGTCQQFIYGGCGGNANRYETKVACEEKCIKSEDHTKDIKKDAETENVDLCSLPADNGPCRASIPKFFFDNKTKSCKSFNYGGCQGNDNNFETVKECEMKCKKSSNLKDVKKNSRMLKLRKH